MKIIIAEANGWKYHGEDKERKLKYWRLPHFKFNEDKWDWELPDYLNDLNAIKEARKNCINTLQLKIKYLNSLREIVSRRLPKNKMNQPIVSDFDLIDASAEEHSEAFVKAMGLYEKVIQV